MLSQFTISMTGSISPTSSWPAVAIPPSTTDIAPIRNLGLIHGILTPPIPVKTEVEENKCAWNGLDIRDPVGPNRKYLVCSGWSNRKRGGRVTQPAIYFTNKSGNDSAVRGNERGTKWGMGNFERNCCGYCLGNLDWLL